MDKQKVYFGRTSTGRYCLFTRDVIVLGLGTENYWETPKAKKVAKEIAERMGFEWGEENE